MAMSLSRPAWYPALSTASRMNLIASSLSRLGAKPPSSPTLVLWPAFFRTRLEGVKDLGDHADALGERLGADGHHHEFLEVDLVVGVLAAVDDVGHRDGQHAGVGAADVAVQRQAVGRGGRLGGGQADAQDRVGAELPLVGRAVGRDQRAVQPDLVGRIATHGDLGQRRVDVGHRLGHAFAEVARLVAVAELDRLVDSRAGPRGNRRPAERAVGQDHVHFDGRVAAAVEDLATDELAQSEQAADSW